MKYYEVNFDGLVGPTHNFAGLSYGNIASDKSAKENSSPKGAALQGLEKMKALSDLGMKQGVLPPQERPHMPTLRKLGFTGSDKEVLSKAAKTNPALLAGASSASCMWVANAATVSPHPDTADGRTHFTPANLVSMFHRSIEHPATGRALQTIFADESRFAHHPALHGSSHFGDEGAANHTRFCSDYGDPGVEFFVYGIEALRKSAPAPKRFPARQTLEACQAVARLHGLADDRVVFAQQNPDVIDQGVFHNDVISVGNGRILFHHEKAFLNSEEVKAELNRKLPGADMIFVEVPDAQVPVEDAVQSYLFNSQLVSCGANGGGSNSATLIAPIECEENPKVRAYLDQLIKSGSAISDVRFFNLRQSMKNGGGPACLRLRVVLNDGDLASLGARVLLDDHLYADLKAWIERHYRDELAAEDLRDPALLYEVRTALEELTRILNLGKLYDFQRG
ncbi:N-succinylarginine dihydrolase [Kiloniella laminariae]|uniref:N-succinylarginine dihydrolase n=1 Tax=Kiloniella laminariae TaxID=454162 RepID=A0ABT4LJ75_9PROT|nr:N-succinylarginine dihydrolase [Kiloniella laminariae]MCZ4280995.1 N-succinylarginine dihydrolase [Kiloniella laminariae]